MPTFISLLRGINVGGHRKIRMADLKQIYEGLGYSDIRTYLQSGNVVFNSNRAEVDHSGAIHAAIAERFGFDVPVLVMSDGSFTRLVDSNPLLERPEIDVSYLHVMFLYATPSVTGIPDEDLPRSQGEEAAFSSGHVILCCPNGYGRTKLTNEYFERVLDVPATTRNWKTVLALRDMISTRSHCA